MASRTKVATTLPLNTTRRRSFSAAPFERQQGLAVARQTPDRHFVDDHGTRRAEPDQIAVFDDERLGDLAFAGDLGVGDQMAGFAVNRDRHPRPDHLVHADQLVARRMAGDVDEMILLGDDLDAEPGQRVLQPADRLLVARE